MRSKTSFFNKAVFLSNLRRFWPVWASCLMLWLILLPVSMAGQEYFNHKQIIAINLQVGIIVNAAYGIITAMAVYSFMYYPKSVSLWGSLPVKREAVFASGWLSGIVMMIGTGLVTFLISLIYQLCSGSADVTNLLIWLAVNSMQAVFFYGLASLCAVLTGSLFVLPVIYVIFNLLVSVLYELIRTLLVILVYGFFTYDGEIYSSFSPIVKMFTWKLRESGSVYDGWAGMIIYCAVGIVMAIGALLLYRKRRLETASDVVAIKVLKPVLRFCMAFGCALVFGLIMYEIIIHEKGHTILLLVLMLIGAFVGYFVSEMLMKKSFRVFKRWPGFVVYAVIMSALVLGLGYDLFGLSTWTPKTEEVQSLSIGPDVDVELTDKADIAAVIDIHRRLIDKKDEAPSEVIMYTVLKYKLANGRTVTRHYPLYYDEGEYEGSDAQKLDSIVNKEVAEKLQQSGEINEKSITQCYVQWYDGSEYKSMEITSRQAYELYKNCILPDALESAVSLAFYRGRPTKDEYTTVYLEYKQREEDSVYYYKSLLVWLYDETSRTGAELEKLKTGLNN